MCANLVMLGSAPRQVRLKTIGLHHRIQNLQLITIVVCLTAFLPGNLAPLQRLSSHGVPVTGTVTGLYGVQKSNVQLGYRYLFKGKSYLGDVPFESSMVQLATAGS